MVVWLSGLQGTNHWPTQDIEVVVNQGGTGGEPEASINHPPAVFTTDIWRKYGERFGFSWNSVNGADYFDIWYRSREFLSDKAWDVITWTEKIDNNPKVMIPLVPFHRPSLLMGACGDYPTTM